MGDAIDLTEDLDQIDDDSEQPSGIDRLRDTLAGKAAEETRLERRLREQAFIEAGVDDLTEGIGLAADQLYDGEPDPDTIRQFMADEFGVEASEFRSPQDEMNAAVAAHHQMQQRVAQMMAGSTPRHVEPPPDAQARHALAEGDTKRAIALKVAQMTEGQ